MHKCSIQTWKKISVQIKLHLTLLFQCVGGRKIASSQTVSVHSYMLSESSRHQTQTLDRTSATRGFRVMPQTGLSRGTTVKATKEEGKHHHGVWMQCKALQSELQRNVCLAEAQQRQPACLGAALSIWLKSHQHNAGILWPNTFVFLLFQFLCGSMFPNILSFPQTMLLYYILNGTC